jgi:hypothetical protein
VMRGGGQQCSIRHSEPRPSNLAAESLELVPQHQQLNVLHVQAAATPNKRRRERPKREVEEGEGHAADPPNLRAQEQRHHYWREVGSRAANAARRTTRKIGRLGAALFFHGRTPLVSGETAAWRRISELGGNGRVR